MTTLKNTYTVDYNHKKSEAQDRLAPYSRPESHVYQKRLGELHAICKQSARILMARGFNKRVVNQCVLFYAAVCRFGLDFLDAQQAGLEALRDVRRERGAA